MFANCRATNASGESIYTGLDSFQSDTGPVAWGNPSDADIAVSKPATSTCMVKSTVNSKWALAYLNGRAKSFRKGNTPIAGVTGSIAMARRHEVSDSAIAAVLGKWNLSWDCGSGTSA